MKQLSSWEEKNYNVQVKLNQSTTSTVWRCRSKLNQLLAFIHFVSMYDAVAMVERSRSTIHWLVKREQ
jgi:hypothetical protein